LEAPTGYRRLRPLGTLEYGAQSQLPVEVALPALLNLSLHISRIPVGVASLFDHPSQLATHNIS
jgi:hypothetical protein